MNDQVKQDTGDDYGTFDSSSRTNAEKGGVVGQSQSPPLMDTSYRRVSSSAVHLPSRRSWLLEFISGIVFRQPSPESNAISTTKYTLLTFIPKNLFEQFHRFANLYFLFMVVLSFIPAVEVFGKEVAAVPLLFVLGVTAVKDIFEDYSRFRSDRQVNRTPCSVYRRSQGRFVTAKWSDLKLGDFVKLSCNEVIPADLLLLHSSDSNGICYVQTSNLDGESTLKHRHVTPGALGASLVNSDSFLPDHFHGELFYQKPSNVINQFNGYIQKPDGCQQAVNHTHLLLRGCVLRNTDSVVGLVVYAGHQTKAMLNNQGPKTKRSKLERDINYDVVSLVCILLVLCIVCAIFNSVWTYKMVNKNIPYFPYTSTDLNPSLEGFIRFWSFLILFQVIIPVSLYVTIEVVKVVQIMFINWDLDVYYSPSDKPIHCRALNITEDLGQVQLVLSDKTGTLTENDMVFCCCSVRGKNYTHGIDRISDQSSNRLSPVHQTHDKHITVDTALRQDVVDSANKDDLFLHDFFVTMAVCNTVVVSTRSSAQDQNIKKEHESKLQYGNESNIEYEAESPDEYALVKAASNYGYVLLSRSPTAITVQNPQKRVLEYEILNVLGFTPERKCMSIIVQEKGDQERIMVYTKGADSTVLNRLVDSDEDNNDKAKGSCAQLTQLHLDMYASVGLRTLCLARRELKQQEYQQWLSKKQEAELDLVNREHLIQESASHIESQLELLGATGIEDRLQECVPETIQSLHKAGVKVWVLTGDKMETAINVGFASNLLDKGMDIVLLQAETQEKCRVMLERQLHEMTNGLLVEEDEEEEEEESTSSSSSLLSTANVVKAQLTRLKSLSRRKGVRRGQNERSTKALVVDGETLSLVLDGGLSKLFLNVAKQCHTVICCRATPLQKALLVQVVKDKTKILTMAVGDGANDVSMIQQAHVGVGIAGREGHQAALASDFSMARFCYLRKLLLVHGHWCYARLARMILYFLYKNTFYAVLQFWFQWFNGFSGSSMLESLNVQIYNLVYTSLPIAVVAVLDQDVKADTLLSKENLYNEGQHSKLYSRRWFFVTMIDAFYQSATLFFIAYFIFCGSNIGLVEFGFAVNLTAVVLVNLHLAIEILHWTWLHHLAVWGSCMMVFAFNFVYTAINIPQRLVNTYWIMMKVIPNFSFWALFLLAPAIALLPRFVMKVLVQMLNPSPVMTARASEKNNCGCFSKIA